MKLINISRYQIIYMQFLKKVKNQHFMMDGPRNLKFYTSNVMAIFVCILLALQSKIRSLNDRIPCIPIDRAFKIRFSKRSGIFLQPTILEL